MGRRGRPAQAHRVPEPRALVASSAGLGLWPLPRAAARGGRKENLLPCFEGPDKIACSSPTQTLLGTGLSAALTQPGRGAVALASAFFRGFPCDGKDVRSLAAASPGSPCSTLKHVCHLEFSVW